MLSHQPIDAEVLADLRQEALSVARQALARRISVIFACRQLSTIGRQAGFPWADPDFGAFYAVDTETDALPMEDVQHLWSSEALAALAPEIAAANEWAEQVSWSAFGSIEQRF